MSLIVSWGVTNAGAGSIARSYNVHHTTIGKLTTANPFVRVAAAQ